MKPPNIFISANQLSYCRIFFWVRVTIQYRTNNFLSKYAKEKFGFNFTCDYSGYLFRK